LRDVSLRQDGSKLKEICSLQREISRRKFLCLGAYGIVALASLGYRPREADALLSRRLSLGVAGGGHSIDGSIVPVDAYTNLVGVKPSVIVDFKPFRWNGSHTYFRPENLNLLQNEYPITRIVLTWEPRSGPDDYGDANPVSLDDINAGTHDTYIAQNARNLKAFGKRIMIRLGHEMNGYWYPWGQQPEKYKQMWHHVRSIFDSERVTNVEWVWCPHVLGPTTPYMMPMADFYPGDAYVDWLSLDGYNAAGNKPWYTFSQIFSQAFTEIFAIHPTKQCLIAETDCADKGGNKGQWFEQMRTYLKKHQPRVRGVCYFHQNNSHANWRIDHPESALDAYQAMADDSQFKASL
jgi:hypothetical protein